MLGVVDHIFTRPLKKRYIRYVNVTNKQLLTHIFTTYRKTTGNDPRQNDIKMNTAYGINLPIEVLFDQVEYYMDYADAGNYPKTTDQIVMTGQQLI